MYVEICGTDRYNYCFAVCCSLGSCSVQRLCPCHKPSLLVSDPLPFCQTVLSASFLCWSEPASSEVMWLCVLSAVCRAILEFPHGLQALFTLSSAALQHLLITACFVCHILAGSMNWGCCLCMLATWSLWIPVVSKMCRYEGAGSPGNDEGCLVALSA